MPDEEKKKDRPNVGTVEPAPELKVPVLFSISSNVDGSVEISAMGNDSIKLEGAGQVLWFVSQLLDSYHEAYKLSQSH